mmetsp:Transcript_18026/g.51614  ORF Transcript_18026/g.51614 Transcript_18026/m.51614 type:complete len:289 (+) Transcript_18026:124-990(+)
MDEEHIFGDKVMAAGQPVVIAKPRNTPSGMTFILTAANIPLAKYLSIRDALLKIDQIVVGFYINALNPPRNNHRIKAEKVREIWNELKNKHRMKQYSIVGHSIGGKIALMTAALHDDDSAIKTIIALDPVDQTPPEFTNANTSRNLTLRNSNAAITITFTESGFFVKKDHNGRAIHKVNTRTQLVHHRNAGHMCYTDDEKGIKALSWKSVMPSGNEERNAACKKEALKLIGSEIPGALTKGIKSAGGMFKKAKNAVTSEIDSITGEAKKATGSVQGKMLLSSLKSAGL